ncbi:CPBP family intramembrane metalloprotease [Aliibacillus thermotolerans]|nr:CPBP family intramembrane metalloprotease [Aliibacillus thermotolerans]
MKRSVACVENSNKFPQDIPLKSVWESFGIFVLIGFLMIVIFYGGNRIEYIRSLWKIDGLLDQVFSGCIIGILFAVIVVFLYKMKWIQLPKNEYTELIIQILKKRYGIVTIALGAGLSEEILFRGAMLGVLVSYFSPVFSLVIVSAIFMALHIPQYKGSVLIHVIIFIMGLGLGGLFLWTEALWAPITAHAVYNGFLSLLMKKNE